MSSQSHNMAGTLVKNKVGEIELTGMFLAPSIDTEFIQFFFVFQDVLVIKWLNYACLVIIQM